ncbi:DUF4129 domain-containing protein [Microbulbifer marinus]|uniref:Uncharacterized protein n=1 Tax=Microbulbifer marinus TaxID=658218 RepID=A0A1H3YSU0_9GAMM|nr:DUF4129 domain-containing protein [Microbulbifer marinus]SEA14122.1 protein of unknown function [Microbulbifer marinus]
MELKNLAVRARLRSPWESIDLGIALARRQWWPLFLVWLLPAALLFATCYWLLPDSPNLSLFLIWWLKPVFDRLPLYIASRALFGETISALAALKQFFAQNRRDWLAWISWRRLSATRSFDMPVTLLEQSTGAARAARIGVLHRKHASAATWLTLTGFHLETFLLLALLMLLYLFIPEQVQIDWLPLFASGAPWLEWGINALYLLVMAAVAPFYIVSGFCLYIGRRIELEGWDIEIQFRNLLDRHQRAQKQRARQASRASVAAQLLLLCAVAITAAIPTHEARAAAADTPAQARETIDEVLAGDDFHRVEEVSGWRLKEIDWSDSEVPEWLIAFFEWLENRPVDPEGKSEWGPFIGLLIEVLLWAAAIGLLAYLLWRYREPIRQSLRFHKKTEPNKAAPDTLFGLDVRQSSLPQDVCAEVLCLWQSGDQRASLGLLYRATLSHLIESYQFAFGDHLTESECAQLVRLRQRQPEASPRQASEPQQAPRPVSAGLSDFVQQLTASWQQLAYAHRAPATARVQSLCDQWQEAFGNDH